MAIYARTMETYVYATRAEMEKYILFGKINKGENCNVE